MKKYIENTILKANASIQEIDTLIYETWKNNFYGICSSSYWTKYIVSHLNWINKFGIENWDKKPNWNFINNKWSKKIKLKKQNKIQVISVIGFPLGNQSLECKCYETKNAIKNGANEIDFVINIGMLLSNQNEFIKKEINSITKIVKNKICKVIIETGYLNKNNLKKIIEIINNSNAQYIKTTTGFGPKLNSIDDVLIIKKYLSKNKKIKASGGIKTYQSAKQLIDLGIQKIGTSNGKKIISEESK